MDENNAIFLSYSHHDRHIAAEVAARLRGVGLPCFMAEEQVTVGEKWERKIRDALKVCQYVLLLVTPRSVGSRWVLMECGAAWVQEKTVVPLTLFVDPEQLVLPVKGFQARVIETESQKKALVAELRALIPGGPPEAPQEITFNDILVEMRRVEVEISKDRWCPDVVIGSGRGGAICGGILAARLGGRPIKVADCQFTYRAGRRITNLDSSSLNRRGLRGKRVLVVESTRQTGETFRRIQAHLRRVEVEDVRSLALIHLRSSRSAPDYSCWQLDCVPALPWSVESAR